MPEFDPRHKVFHSPDEMEDWELLAVIIGKGTRNKSVETLSREILYKISGIGGLNSANSESLQELSGLGRAKTASLLAVKEISSRLKISQISSNQIPFDETLNHLAETLYLKSITAKRECFYLMTFSHQKAHLNTRLIAKGSLDEVGVHTRDILKLMLDDGASFAIIAHNHPNDSCRPSSDDLHLYAYLKDLLVPIEIELLDQWIFGIDGIHSCKQNKKINLNAERITEKNTNYTHTG